MPACRAFLEDVDPTVRQAALGGLGRAGALDEAVLQRALGDPVPAVRRRALEEAGRALATAAPSGQPERSAAAQGGGLVTLVARSLEDPDPSVVEVAAWATGEAGQAGGVALGRLLSTCRHPDPLCREAAVAALGAIGHPGGLGAVLEALQDKPAVRRRAVLALAAFDHPDAEAALRHSTSDRDWQVRQAAEELLDDRRGPGEQPP